MKHFKICISVFCLVIFFTFFVDYNATLTIDNLINYSNILILKEDILENQYDYQNINDVFYKNKNMLFILMNKEHIKEIDILINELNLAFENDNSEKAKETSLKLYTFLKYSKSNIYSII